jgi:hypothetical protein
MNLSHRSNSSSNNKKSLAVTVLLVNTFMLLSLLVSQVDGFCFLRNCQRPTTTAEEEDFPPTPPHQQQQQQYCQKLYEWTINDDQLIYNKQYYGFVLSSGGEDDSTSTSSNNETNVEQQLLSPKIGTYTLPVYDNVDLIGQPVARLRGNLITSTDGLDFLATATFQFFDDDNNHQNDQDDETTTTAAPTEVSRSSNVTSGNSMLGVHVSYSYRPGEGEDSEGGGFVYGYTTGGTGRFISPSVYNADIKSVVIVTEPQMIVEWTFCSSSAVKLVE